MKRKGGQKELKLRHNRVFPVWLLSGSCPVIQEGWQINSFSTSFRLHSLCAHAQPHGTVSSQCYMNSMKHYAALHLTWVVGNLI